MTSLPSRQHRWLLHTIKPGAYLCTQEAKNVSFSLHRLYEQHGAAGDRDPLYNDIGARF